MAATEQVRGSTRAASPLSNIDPVSLLTSEVRTNYERDGVVMIPGALHQEWLLLVELGLQRVLANAGQQKHLFFGGEQGEFVETIRNTEVTPELQRLVYDSPIADVIGALIGSENIWLYSDEFFVKEGGSCERTPWHQDTPYWPIAGDQIASMWISLDPLPAEECLEYVAGSHKGPIYDGFAPSRVREDPTYPHYGKGYPPLPDIEADRSSWNIVSWDIQPGDVIVAHPSVLHGGGPTGPTSRRRALTVRCYGDDIVYDRRPDSRPTVPLTPGLSLALNPGDPLRSPWYPRLRPIPASQLSD
ncbi:MAG: phytanoyl-CoA dioxygenase family protein [Acidimicrobiales bacterium]